MRKVVAGICPKHGFYSGEDCPSCVSEVTAAYFNTSRDKLWEFVDIHTTGKPVNITSKRQWKNHLKSLNMTDDISHTRSIGRGKFTPTPREEVKTLIRNEMKERGIYDKSKLFIKKKRW